MFVKYVREFLQAEDGLSEREKTRLAEQIEKWASSHDVQDMGRVHDMLDRWIDERLKKAKERSVLSLDYPIGENAEFVDLIEDPTAQNPADIIVADEEFTRISEPGRYPLLEFLDDESRTVLQSVIDQNPEREYTVNADEQLVSERVSIIRPRLRHGKLLVPKKTVSIRFVGGKLEIKYTRGFSDDKVNDVLSLYSQGLNPTQIASRTGMKYATVYDWLYKRMDLPRIGRDHTESHYHTTEILRLYKNGLRPAQIKQRLGCSDFVVYNTLKNYLGLNFGWGGPDSWVYELTGNSSTSWDLRKNDVRYTKVNRNFNTANRYRSVFSAIEKFQRAYSRGPSRDELYCIVGFQPWCYLQDLVKLEVLNKRKLPKEEQYTARYGEMMDLVFGEDPIV